MKIRGNSSYKPSGASYTAQGPQEQPEIVKKIFVLPRQQNIQTLFFGPGFRFPDFGSRF